MTRLLFACLLLVVGCGASPKAPLAPADPTPALPGPADGWGVVFERNDGLWKVGGGSTLVGPYGIGAGTTEGTSGECGGLKLTTDVAHPRLVLPEGTVGQAPSRPSPVDAARVEAAAWRLDEALPPRDRFTPTDPNAAPAAQRGVQVGSVIKVRRFGGPPVHTAVGSRDCQARLLILDADARQTLAQLDVPEVCDTPRLLPPTDLDGDGNLETALLSESTVVLVRLRLEPATATIEALGQWRCASLSEP